MPAFAHWPAVVSPGSVAYTTISTLDVLPSLLHLLGLPPPRGRIVDGTLSLADAVLAPGDAPTRHAFLPFYNEPAYGNASRRIFAARFGKYKAHWITSPGLGGGLLPYSSPSPEASHVQPLIYNVAADPAEAFPLSADQLPDHLIDELHAHKAAYESRLTPTSIDARWGYEFALCCGVGCTPPCKCQCTDVALPL
jgi:arylsulfatase A-like enzyme